VTSSTCSARLRVERVHVARFDARFAALQPNAFIEDVLVRGSARGGCSWAATSASVPAGRATLRRCRDNGFYGRSHARRRVRRQARVQLRGARRAQRRRLRGAERLLGHPYTISGRVAHGAKARPRLGFPTANIVLRRPPPIAGVFVVEVDGLAEGKTQAWRASAGARPSTRWRSALEVHLFDRDKDLYGEASARALPEKLRDEESTTAAGVAGCIARDARQAREFFLKHG
jgi:riboflavin kinase/FMN adenylyltransferase